MATIEFVPYGVSNPTNSSSKWGRVMHDAVPLDADDQLALQLWKQQHKQGVFNASTKYGFTGRLTRMQTQRRSHW
jgi:hypothetical protein